MNVTEWTLKSAEAGPGLQHYELAREHVLVRDAIPIMKAEIKARCVNGRPALRVAFRGAHQYHVEAEAARLYAELLDTAGDLTTCSDDPLQIDAPNLDGNSVIVVGDDAPTAVFCFFAGATDALLDVYIHPSREATP